MTYALKPDGALRISFLDPPERRHRAFGDASLSDPNKTTLSKAEVSTVVRAATDLDGISVVCLDDNYYCAPLPDYERVVKMSGRDRLSYGPTKVNSDGELGPDCDDFAWVLRSAFVMDAYRNGLRRLPYCFGLIVVTKWSLGNGDVDSGSHALNWFIAADKKLWFMDTTDDGYIYWPAPSKPQKAPLLEFRWGIV